MSDDLAARREQYREHGFTRAELSADPFAQFQRWFHDWLATGPYDATAVSLATADADGRPSLRVVLLKGVDHGFVFFTNQESRKGTDLAANPHAALCAAWIDVQRQVRVTGPIEVVSTDEADAYFATRPRGSQLAAWASDQTQPITDRPTLEARFADAEARYADQPVPRPPYWGGYRLIPDEFEFWQGRANRMHDRCRYRRAGDGWVTERLMP